MTHMVVMTPETMKYPLWTFNSGMYSKFIP